MCIPQAAQGVWAVGGAVEGGGGGGGGGSDGGGGGGGGGGSDEDWGDEWKAPKEVAPKEEPKEEAPEEQEEVGVQEFHLPEDDEQEFAELMEAAQESPFLSIAMWILSPRISF
jgi:hypothetical protein